MVHMWEIYKRMIGMEFRTVARSKVGRRGGKDEGYSRLQWYYFFKS